MKSLNTAIVSRCVWGSELLTTASLYQPSLHLTAPKLPSIDTENTNSKARSTLHLLLPFLQLWESIRFPSNRNTPYMRGMVINKIHDIIIASARGNSVWSSQIYEYNSKFPCSSTMPLPLLALLGNWRSSLFAKNTRVTFGRLGGEGGWHTCGRAQTSHSVNSLVVGMTKTAVPGFYGGLYGDGERVSYAGKGTEIERVHVALGVECTGRNSVSGGPIHNLAADIIEDGPGVALFRKRTYREKSDRGIRNKEDVLQENGVAAREM
ncbi:hypothetical protein CPC08DRAFT_502408 [Agrocybe pediades]|nr:hypothetical protein CPC08DRAFT_502408 [Agrocybe pediades]